MSITPDYQSWSKESLIELIETYQEIVAKDMQERQEYDARNEQLRAALLMISEPMIYARAEQLKWGPIPGGMTNRTLNPQWFIQVAKDALKNDGIKYYSIREENDRMYEKLHKLEFALVTAGKAYQQVIEDGGDFGPYSQADSLLGWIKGLLNIILGREEHGKPVESEDQEGI